jgi:hypothetical protein
MQAISTTLRHIALLGATSLVLAGSATAQHPGNPGSHGREIASNRRPPTSLNAPEINPALIGGAVTLLIGGLLILSDSMRRRTLKTTNARSR